MTNIKDVIRDTSVITEREVDQGMGCYRHSKPCCVGALLAGHFKVHRDNSYDYMRGYKAFAEALGGNGAHVIMMLRQAGAGEYPFNSKDWDIPVKEVWNNLYAIETLPTITEHKFHECNFEGHNFDDIDLTRCDFFDSDFTDASLKNAVCVETDFTCDMRRANFSGAYLDRCNFAEADLGLANFSGATIIKCRFGNVFSIEGAVFEPEHYESKYRNKGLPFQGVQDV